MVIAVPSSHCDWHICNANLANAELNDCMALAKTLTAIFLAL